MAKAQRTRYRNGKYHDTRDLFLTKGGPIDLLFRDPGTWRITLRRDTINGPETVTYTRLSKAVNTDA